jgi:hypothetical protein
MKLTHLIAGAVVATTSALFLPACQTMKVPGDAGLVASGIGNTTYVAQQSGTVYVYDKSWDKIVYSGDVHAGQTINLDANNDKLFIDGQVRVEQIPLGEGSEYQIFVRPVRTVVERRTIIERERPVYERPIDRRDIVIEREYSR